MRCARGAATVAVPLCLSGAAVSTAASVHVSAEGAIVFFAVSYPSRDEVVQTSHVVNVNGTQLRRIRDDAESWRWSPGGAKVVYGAVGRNRGVYVMNTDGSGRRRLVRTTGWDFSWSPKGRSFVYVSPSPFSSVWVVELSGRRRRIADYGREPGWSPDGKRITFLGPRTGLFLVNSDGTGLEQIDRGAWSGARWSADGRQLAYVRAIPGEEETRSPGATYLFVNRLAGEQPVPALPIVPLPVVPLEPKYEMFEAPDFAWSPRGAMLAFTTLRNELFVVRSDGHGLRPLTTGIVSHTDAGPPAWSPDGRRLAVVRGTTYGGSAIWVINVDGTGARQVTKKWLPRGWHLQPKWDPKGRDAARIGR